MPVNYREAYQNLKQKCTGSGIKVEEVCDSKTKDFVGMNPEAAKAFGYKGIGKNTIYIDNWLDNKAKYHTLKHELIEMKLMDGGKKYWAAHKIALKREKYGR